jgi:hypothetical protein
MDKIMKLKINSKHIEWVDHVFASSSSHNISACYADVGKARIKKKLIEAVSAGDLPREVEVTGEVNLSFKIASYQNDGFWFRSTSTHKDKIWKLWIEAEEAICGPKPSLPEIIKQKHKKGKK